MLRILIVYKMIIKIGLLIKYMIVIANYLLLTPAHTNFGDIYTIRLINIFKLIKNFKLIEIIYIYSVRNNFTVD